MELNTTIPTVPSSTQDIMSNVSLILLSLSAFLVIPVISANVCLKKRRNSPSIYSSLFLSTSLLFSCTMLTSNRHVADLLNYSVNTSHCWLQGIVVQFSATSMMMTWLIVSHVLHQIVVKYRRMNQIMAKKYYLIFVWWLIPSTVLTILPFLFKPPVWQSNLDFCWLNEDTMYQLLSFHVWMLIITFLGAKNLVPVLKKLHNHWRNGTTNTTVKDYIVRHTMFILFFSLVFILVSQYAVTLWFVKVRPLSGKMKWFLVLHEQWYTVSVQIMNIAYSSIGILGFLVFGTAHSLLQTMCSCCLRNNRQSNELSVLRPSFTEPLVNESIIDQLDDEEEDSDFMVINYSLE